MDNHLPAKRPLSSWLELIFFTLFLFLLVAIPYTIYLKSVQPKAAVQILDIPKVTRQAPLPSITPPPPTTTTTCFPVPTTYLAPTATPAAYLFAQDQQNELCFVPELPPFPFTWQPYTNTPYGYTIDTPSNWINNSTTIKGTLFHIYASEESASASATPTVSFAWYPGADPYATQSSYLKVAMQRSGVSGSVYTQGTAFIAAVFPIKAGYLLLEGSRIDSAFYAFEHMLDSLKFTPST